MVLTSGGRRTRAKLTRGGRLLRRRLHPIATAATATSNTASFFNLDLHVRQSRERKRAVALASRRQPLSDGAPSGPGSDSASYASSSSIFFAAASSFTMRKLRIWPERTGSRLAPWPPFHLACSMEVSEEISAESASASFLSGSGAPPFLRP